MSIVRALGYVGTYATDLGAWRDYTREVLGLEISPDSDDSRLYLKMDELHHRFAVQAGDTDDVAYVGWDVGNAAGLAAARRALEESGIVVKSSSEDERFERRVLDFIWFECPFTGVRSELFIGAHTQFQPRFGPTRAMSGFVTGDQGMGHVVLYVENPAEAARFYVDVLGFGVSDWALAPGHGVVGAFMHCNPRHHSLGLFTASGSPRRIQHVMIQTKEIDTVGSTYDIADERGIVSATLGRHVNDRAFSFYFRTPSGWHLEYGWGARTVDPETWRTEVYDVTAPDTEWGHKGILRVI
ncbi:VOC family protein [Streptomyces sp. NPDC091217]|uniref:VOC family protein n=1 Tax=Streptomyces sp. NPDC091217 TaxID=3365975 RepID=UPI003825EC2E